MLIGIAVLLLIQGWLELSTLGDRSALKGQSRYTNVWLIILGVWMQWQLFGDIGLTLVIAVASGLWPLSHLQY